MAAYFQTSDPASAIGYLEKPVALDPRSSAALEGLAYDDKVRDRCSDSMPYARRLMAADPCYANGYLNLADCDRATGNVDAAIADMQSFAQHCPSPQPLIAISLAQAYMDLAGDLEKAKQSFEDAFRYPQGTDFSGEDYLRLAVCYFKLGDAAKAKDTLLAGLKADPTDASIKATLEEMSQGS